jgi:zona occludens toxin
MLELITGTPGAGKSALAVSEVCKSVPGSFITASDRVTSHGVTYEKGDQVPRHLFTNIPGLLLDHTFIDADGFRTWHKWADPGDVIVFDEAQEVWRPRALGKEVPEEIAALETHRHRGVDIVVITQHPMLIDSNVRRLVNRHRHVRLLPANQRLLYEWDHQGTPGSYKTCTRKVTWRPKKADLALYRSAQLHTKPTVRMPVVLLGVMLAAIVGAFVMVPQVVARVSGKATEKEQAALASARAASAPASAASAPGAFGVPGLSVSMPALASMSAASAALPGASASTSSAPPSAAGCMMVKSDCRCFSAEGARVFMERPYCLERLPQGGQPVTLSAFKEIPAPVDTAQLEADLQLRADMYQVNHPREVPHWHGEPLRINGKTVGQLR